MKIGIIGGGASGMIISSMFENTSHSVTIIEKNNKLGKKLLLTGNGKCNFTSKDFSDINKIYNNDLAKNLYEKYDYNSCINFYESIGVVAREEKHKGKSFVYPNSGKATSVYYALLDRIIANNIKIKYDEKCVDIAQKGNKFLLTTDKNKYDFDIIIFATGGVSAKNTGSDGEVFQLINKMGHNIVDLVPGLTGLRYEDKDLLKVSKVRCEANVKLYVDNAFLTEEFGEVQFNDGYVSGYPIMNLSRYTNRYLTEGKKINLSFDFYYNIFKATKENIKTITKFPDTIYKVDNYEYFSYVRDALLLRQKNIPYKRYIDFLCGFVPDEIGAVIMNKVNENYNIVKDIDNSAIDKIVKQIIDFNISICGFNSFDNAQVTLGGVDINDIVFYNLESKHIKNIYFIGEVIDIDGACGGYNLQMCYSTARAVYDDIRSKYGK